MGDEEFVEVELQGLLVKYGPGGKTATVRAGQTVLEAARNLGIPEGRPVVALVNGMVSELSYQLRPGDRVKLIPPIAGGGC